MIRSPSPRSTVFLVLAMVVPNCWKNRPVAALASVPAATVGSNQKMPPMNPLAEHIPLAREAMAFIDASPDPFHAVMTSMEMLTAAGFEELKDFEPYAGKIFRGGKYFFTKNKSTLVAFAVGNQYQAGNGFKVIGGHTDSPNLKVKPRSKRTGSGCIQLDIECYGGGLWHTWFDRDLGICGRVFLRMESGEVEQRLVKIDRPIVRIPNLAIHLQTADEIAAFKINKEDHLSPILAMEVKKALTGGSEDRKEDGWTEFQEPILLNSLASELGVTKDKIVDFELNLFDTQKAALGGAFSEFVHSARLDNLMSCFLALRGLISHVSEGLLEDDGDISLIALFDHEEVGSSSATGAGAPVMAEAVKRISSALNAGAGNDDLYGAALARSYVLSVDQAHAIHPNYAAKHQKGHAPKMNGGMVIKRNSNQRYATTGLTGLVMREIARRAGLPPVQEFVVRNDCRCGSTIGPIISAATGIRAIDMGCPQLSMHSIRETMGTADITHGLALFKAYFKLFTEVNSSIQQ